MKHHGLRVEGNELWVAKNSVALSKILAGTPWPSHWSRVLSRLPGSGPANRSGLNGNGRAVRFSDDNPSKATAIPLHCIYQDHEG